MSTAPRLSIPSGADSLSAEEVVRLLELSPHPEGGYFRETFRDERTVDNGRAASTLIYYLLEAGQESAWHRIDAVEVWHWYAGAPLALSLSGDMKKIETHLLGNNLTGGERPQAVVPEGWWQSAKSTGAWTLIGCSVAPGFSFEGFEMLDKK